MVGVIAPYGRIESATTFVQYRDTSTADIVRSLKPLVQFGEQVSGWCAAKCRAWRHPVAFAIQQPPGHLVVLAETPCGCRCLRTVVQRGPGPWRAKQETPIDMHLINASNINGRFATSLPGAARLLFDPDHSITPRTNPAPRPCRLVRGHYSAHTCSIPSPVALNVSLRKE